MTSFISSAGFLKRLARSFRFFILELEDGKQRYIKTVTELSKAFALVSSLDEAIAIRDEVSFFQAIKAAMVKSTTTGGKSPEDLDAAVRQIVSKAVAS